MILIGLMGMKDASSLIRAAKDAGADAASAAAAAGMGFMGIFVVWVVGALVLGVLMRLTRPRA